MDFVDRSKKKKDLKLVSQFKLNLITLTCFRIFNYVVDCNQVPNFLRKFSKFVCINYKDSKKMLIMGKIKL